MVHLYLRVVIFPQAASHVHAMVTFFFCPSQSSKDSVFHSAPGAIQTQVAPGTFSETIVTTFQSGVDLVSLEAELELVDLVLSDQVFASYQASHGQLPNQSIFMDSQANN